MKKFALLGVSHIHTSACCEEIAARSDVEVVAIWDPDPAIAHKYAHQFNCEAKTEVSAVLNTPDLEAVIVLSETFLHEALVLQITAAKKHCFVEKPLALGLADARKIKQALETSGVIFQTGYYKRYHPAHRFLKQQITERKFGKISRIRLDFGTTGVYDDIYKGDWLWMTDLEKSGFGAFGDVGTHSLDLLLFLIGDLAELTAVTATFTRPLQRYPGYEECGESILRFTNGILATMSAGLLDWVEPTSLIITGTEGHAFIRGTPGMPHQIISNRDIDTGDDLFFFIKGDAKATGKEPWTDLPPELPVPLNLFIDAVIKNQSDHLVSAHEAAYRSYVMEALYQGAAEQRWVTIDSHAL